VRPGSFPEHDVRHGSLDSLKSTNDERKRRPVTSRACNTLGFVHSAARVIRMGAGPSPTISPGTPLEMLRRKVQTEKKQRHEAARGSVKQRLHDHAASVSFKQLSGAEQAAFWVGSRHGPSNFFEEYADASRLCMLLSEGGAEFARLPAVPQEAEGGEMPPLTGVRRASTTVGPVAAHAWWQHVHGGLVRPRTPPAAQSEAWKSWAMDPADDLFRVGSDY